MAMAISRDEAMSISKTYVNFVEGDFDCVGDVLWQFSRLSKGDKVLTYVDGEFVIVKISSMRSDDPRAVDGPIVRVSNGKASWRVDGDKYAWPMQ